jgi:hypothetical protein
VLNSRKAQKPTLGKQSCEDAVKSIIWLLVSLIVATAAYAADGPPPVVVYESGIPQFSRSWTPLPLLPRRFQNHCGYINGAYVCADRCWPNYQIYFCSEESFGCCHVGQGYCNAGGILRCSPHYFPFN